MKTIHYRITFFSPWHAGSGLSSGSDLDLLVVKGDDNLPYIPGRTIKGLFREAAEELFGYQSDLITKAFGFFDQESDSESEIHTEGKMHFANATILPQLKSKITKEKAAHFYSGFSSTAIQSGTGIAEKGTLRRIETTIPCALYGSLSGVDDEFADNITACMRFIKRLGLNRTRGLGRCVIEPINIMEE
jgi:CRISPR/Cas system CSM-associated protein Csm3 (group 7 of RAMP superfamily)